MNCRVWECEQIKPKCWKCEGGRQQKAREGMRLTADKHPKWYRELIWCEAKSVAGCRKIMAGVGR